MKRKNLLAIGLVSVCLLAGGCGSETAQQEGTTEIVVEVTETEEEETVATESILETEATEKNISTDTSINDKIVESVGWPDYKKTMDYYVENGILSEQTAYLMNPDVYGTELAGKAAFDVDTGTGSPNAGIYIKQLKTTTTKGFPMEAYWYTETNTVQYVYCDEASPGGGWYVGSTDTMCYLHDNGSTPYSLDMTRQERIELLGEPSMTDEEVIAALSSN